MSSRALKKLSVLESSTLSHSDLEEDSLLSLNQISKNKKKNKKKKEKVMAYFQNEELDQVEAVEVDKEVLEDLDDFVDSEGDDLDIKEETKELKSDDIKVESDFDEHIQPKSNPFDLLETDDLGHIEETWSSDGDQEADDQIKQNQPTPSKKNLRKKKKKSKRPVKEVRSNLDDETSNKADLEAFDKLLEEVNQRFKAQDLDLINQTTDSLSVQLQKSQIEAISKLLSIEAKWLDPITESTRLFGAKIVNQELKKTKNYRFGRCILSQPKDFWPLPQKSGLTTIGPELKDDGQYYHFAHHPKYREAQRNFYQSIGTFDPRMLMQLSHVHPYHIDTLLQLSEVAKTQGQISEAGEFIERALFGCEKALDPKLSLLSGMVRINYDQLENRPFYLALYRHLQFLARKGCWRTCLEFSKLILSLDPIHDNLGVLLHLDFFALRAQEYQYLLNFYKEWIDSNGLITMPNFRYSCALAGFYINIQPSKSTTASNEVGDVVDQLSDAMILFPAVILGLVKKNNLQIGDLSSIQQHHDQLVSIIKGKQESLITVQSELYVERAHSLWKEADSIGFMNSALTLATNKLLDLDNPSVILAKEIYSADSTNEIPLNICRHLLCSDYETLKKYLPTELKNQPHYAHDPLPPPNSASLYDDFQYLPGYGNRIGSNRLVGTVTDSVQYTLESLRNLFHTVFQSNHVDQVIDEILDQPADLNEASVGDLFRSLWQRFQGEQPDDQVTSDTDLEE